MQKAPAEARIQSKIAESDSKIGGLGQAVSILNVVKDAALRLNDAKDARRLPSAIAKHQLSAPVNDIARAGSNNITVSQINKSSAAYQWLHLRPLPSAITASP